MSATCKDRRRLDASGSSSMQKRNKQLSSKWIGTVYSVLYPTKNKSFDSRTHDGDMERGSRRPGLQGAFWRGTGEKRRRRAESRGRSMQI